MIANQYMGIIILTMRNGLAYTKTCLKSLQSQTNQPLLILAVDNASSDGTAAYLRSEAIKDSNLRVMTFGSVVSVAYMWNQALKEAWGWGFSHALVVNNDTELLPDTHLRLDAFEQDDRLGMVTCVSRRTREELVFELPFTTRDNPDFSCYLLAKWAWERIGGFDENCIGGYYEDNVAHVEMHRAGIQAICISLPFLHYGGTTIGQAGYQERRRIEANVAHNREYFRSKYGCVPGTKGYESLFQ